MRLASVLAAALAASSAAAGEPELARGRAVYRDACASCHGPTGAGDGPGAAELEPRPRDFVNGSFKFRSTPSGARPLLRDVVRTVSAGIRGTWMPAFGKILTADDLRAVSAYVLAFAPPEEPADPEVLVPPAEELQPPADTPELRERGKALYEKMGCGQCHGPEGRGDGPAKRAGVAPLDFTVGLYKGGSSPGDVYRTFVTGLDGTPMPSYAESLPEESDRWALVHYVRSLSRSPGPWQWLFGPRTPWE